MGSDLTYEDLYIREIDDFRYEDFEIVNYVAAPHIAAPIAV